MPRFNSTIKQSLGRFFTAEVDSFAPGTLTTSSIKAQLCGNENVKLYLDPDTCTGALDPIYFIANINDPNFEIEEEYYENEFGEKNLKYKVGHQLMSISVTADTLMRNDIYKMILANEFLRIDFETTWLNNKISHVEVTDDDKIEMADGTFWFMTIQFQMDNLGAVGTSPCCGTSIFSEAPYESECPDPDPDPEACTDLSISLSEAGGVISLTVTNPFGSPTSSWTFVPEGGGSPVFLGNNLTSVAAPAYGTINVTYSVGSCRKTSSIVYLDPCTGFEVSIANNSGAMTATVDDAHSPATYQWSYSELGDTYTNLGATQSQAASEGEGFYKVIATKGGCTSEDIVNVTDIITCFIEGEIDKVGNILSFSSPAVGLTYQWFIQIDDVIVPIVGATDPDYTATESGMYYLDVTNEDDCTYRFSRVHLMCTDCAAFTVDMSNSGDVITADVSGCGEPEYFWYKVNVDGSTTQVGDDSDSYTLTGDGLYFVSVCCGDCESKTYLINKTGGTIIFINGQLSDLTAWGS